MTKRRRDFETFSLSFLDVISCGFGAIILLLVLSKIYEPVIIEKTQADLEALIALLQQELFDIRGETAVLNRDLVSVREQTSTTKMTLARLQGELDTVQGQYAATFDDAEEAVIDEGDLRAARQTLTEEMLRLQPYYKRPDDDAVAGIPVDSEYIIFVIDTSGSMQQYNWGRVQRKLTETLEVYPEVKGLQILNDNGQYMFQQYAGKWIPDTPGRRQAIMNTMRTWAPFSDSNPVDGIMYAIDTFWSPDKKISIYVFGDDFGGKSAEPVVRAIAQRNKVQPDGSQMVRIHAVGFPLFQFGGGRVPAETQKFAALMRVLCERNGGTFVGLTGAG
ncbi:MAG: VWA domain-containing protein [Woeseia sp.]